MIEYIKTLGLSLVIISIFTACASKEPIFSKQTLLEEANTCQLLKTGKEKVLCYEEMSEHNSIATLRLGINHASYKNYDKAFELFTSAKDNGNYYANLPLAYLYFQGTGVKKDLNKALELLQSSSIKDVNAAYQLSKFHLEGLGIKKDKEKGLDLLTKAANKGMFVAQKQLAVIYLKGLYEVTIDKTKSESWVKKAKENKTDKTFNIYKL